MAFPTRSPFQMILLSDTQAEVISGGRKSDGPAFVLQRSAGKSSNLPIQAGKSKSFVNNTLNLVIAPLINLSVIVATNGSTAISGNQSNSLKASLA